jgi:hypothetical protein
MKRIISLVASVIIGASAASVYTINVKSGWQLKGALQDINASVFNNSNIVSVWAWDDVNQKWRVYLPNKTIDLGSYGVESLDKINKGEGFWINATGYASIYVVSGNGGVITSGNNTASSNDNVEAGDNDIASSNDNVEAVDNNTTSENNEGYEGDHIAQYLVDKPVNFELSDVAGKTFKIITDEGVKDLAFDENGNAEITVSGVPYNVKFDNGVIKVYLNEELVTEFKKIKSDNNGIVVFGTYYYKAYFNNATHTDTDEFLDGWSTNINPIDMSTLSYPKTFYDEREHFYINSDGTINFPWDDVNYTFENGAIVTTYSWGSDTYGGYGEDSYQIVNQIDRYYVVKITENNRDWYIDENLKGKTFDDIIDSNISIDGRYFHSDGTVTFEYDSDLNVTYEKISSTELNITEFYPDEEIWSYELVIDPNTGKVTRIYNFTTEEIWSDSPIVQESSARKKVDIKTYLELKRERVRKRKF